jgi:hypothetical protein
MKCQVKRPRFAVALQGQFLARLRRLMGGPRGVLCGGVMVELCAEVRVLVAVAYVLVSMCTPNPDTSILCNLTVRSRARLRAGLTGRTDDGDGFPGFHPGLVELALQAEIARGLLGLWRVAVEPRFWSSCNCRPAVFPACKASSISLA